MISFDIVKKREIELRQIIPFLSINKLTKFSRMTDRKCWQIRRKKIKFTELKIL